MYSQNRIRNIAIIIKKKQQKKMCARAPVIKCFNLYYFFTLLSVIYLIKNEIQTELSLNRYYFFTKKYFKTIFIKEYKKETLFKRVNGIVVSYALLLSPHKNISIFTLNLYICRLK